jgi:orotate phosphoribosyltransferase
LNLIDNQLKRKELMEIIKRNGIIVSSQPIVLSSGEKSNYYYDLKMVLADPVGATLIGELLYDIIAREFSAKSVGGLEMGARIGLACPELRQYLQYLSCFIWVSTINPD